MLTAVTEEVAQVLDEPAEQRREMQRIPLCSHRLLMVARLLAEVIIRYFSRPGGVAGRHPVRLAQEADLQVPATPTAECRPERAATVALRTVPPLATLALTLWGIRGASFSRDEVATLSAVQRSFPELLRMLGNVDATHGAYYAVIWLVVRVAGPGELATRLPSALAMAVAAAAVTGLGQRLVSPRAGLAAGLVFAILPQVSQFGQTARPYAIVTALAAIASYLLVRAMQAAAAGDGVRGWLTSYAACLAALGYMHLFGLLLAAAHAVPVARAWLRHVGGQRARSLSLGWLAATAGGLASAIPLMMAAVAQQGTSLTWARAPAARSIISLTNLIGPPLVVVPAGLAVLCAIAVSAMAGRARLRANWPGDMIALCLPWLILPGAILIGISVITPEYVFRYVIFCAPAAALLVGAGLAALGWKAGAAALAVIMALAVSAHLQMRATGGIRTADQIVARNMRPGDVLLYQTINEPIAWAYPYGLRRLRNVELAQTPGQSATLGGTRAPMPLVWHRLANASRVWFVQLTCAKRDCRGRPPPTLQKILQSLHFTSIRTWHTTIVWLSLYVRHPGPDLGSVPGI